MTQFSDYNSDEVPVVAQPRRHELLIELLKLLTAVVALVSAILAITGKYPWLSKPWVYEIAFVLGVFVLLWFAKPRFTFWLNRNRSRKQDQQFISDEGIKLEKLVAQFSRFISTSDQRSLIAVLRTAFQREDYVVQTFGSEYISSWLDCYRSELKWPVSSLDAFLSRCQQFAAIVKEFNRNHVIPTQRKIEKTSEVNLQETYLDQLEEFREEFNAYLRSVEQWTTEISEYATSRFGDSAGWRHAPLSFFERVKPFRQPKPVVSASRP